MKNYYIYIITNYNNTVLYTGVTNNLERRIQEHKNKIILGFSSKYNLNKIVYYEQFSDIEDAISREKQIKGGSREKKIVLINNMNPEWKDLSVEK
jgi:putative endonuclease